MNQMINPTLAVVAATNNASKDFFEYTIKDLVPQMEKEGLTLPPSWDEEDWFRIVLSIALNWAPHQILRDLQLHWKTSKQNEKIMGANEIIAIKKIRGYLKGHYDEIREVFSGGVSKYFTMADKTARIERNDFWMKVVDEGLSELYIDDDFSITDPAFQTALVLYMRMSSSMNKEMGVKKIFEHRVIKEDEITEESILKAAKKFGVNPKVLEAHLISENYAEQLVKPINADWEEVEHGCSSDNQ